jgi:hypothetical protein
MRVELGWDREHASALVTTGLLPTMVNLEIHIHPRRIQ